VTRAGKASSAGFADFEDYTWTGLFAPTGTPAEVVQRLNALANEALRQPDVRDKLAASGLEAQPGSPAAFACSPLISAEM